jgi:diguanylate cyclase (GGDEF)-like protein
VGANSQAVADIVYLAFRLTLSGFVIMAAVACLRAAARARHDSRPWHVAAAGGVLLILAGVLSVCDLYDNLVLRPHEPISLSSWLWLLLFDSLVPIWSFMLLAAWRERDRALVELSRLSVTDQLTGALNRRGFLDRAARSVAEGRRHGRPAAVIMLDIDHFKRINDNHGHAVGDEILRAVATVLQAGMRPGDLLGRLGGEEFAAYLPDSSSDMAASIGNRLLTDIRSSVPHPSGGEASVTVSGGVAQLHATFEPEAALSIALTSADTALYAAKQQGRDRIVAARETASA